MTSEEDRRRFASEVGKAFVKEYYSRYSRRPLDLIDMYSKESHFCHCDIGASPGFIRGLEKIKLELESLGGVGERKFKLLTVDCMPSLADSIVVLNTGVMLTREAYRDFAHTFVLAPTPGSGWYVHNDFMRLGENQEDGKHEEEDEEEEPEQALPPAPRENAWGGGASAASKIRAPPPPSPPPPAERAPSPPPDQKKKAPPAARSPARQASPEVSPKQSPKAPPSQAAAAQASPRADAPKPEAREGKQGRGKKAAPQPVEEEAQEEEKGGVVTELTWAALVSTAPASAAGRTTRVTAPSSAAAKPTKPAAEEERPKKSAGAGREQSPQSRQKVAEEQTPAKFRWASLYVTQLPEGFSEDDVEKIFAVYGEIKGHTFKASERYCFVDFENRASVERALAEAESEGISFKGTRLRVQERKSPEQRAAERSAAGGSKTRPSGGKGSGGGKGRREG
eukprot:Hpha_TRINITY_DN16294_c2_g2::TRINITY_DN16294_c2_g2_i2::g.12335::m.12335